MGVRELNARLARAAIGKAGDDAITAFADAYRAFAHAHPGLYSATQRAPGPDDDELHAAADGVVETIVAVLAAYGLEGDDAVHTVRALRSSCTVSSPWRWGADSDCRSIWTRVSDDCYSYSSPACTSRRHIDERTDSDSDTR